MWQYCTYLLVYVWWFRPKFKRLARCFCRQDTHKVIYVWWLHRACRKTIKEHVSLKENHTLTYHLLCTLLMDCGMFLEAFHKFKYYTYIINRINMSIVFFVPWLRYIEIQFLKMKEGGNGQKQPQVLCNLFQQHFCHPFYDNIFSIIIKSSSW